MRRLWFSVAAVVIAAGVLTACSSSDDGEEPSSKGTTAAGAKETGSVAGRDTTKDVRITRSGFEDHEVWGPHAYVVHYKITNHGSGRADYFAQFEFLDADGDRLGTTGVTADKLGAGKTKAADAAPLDVEIENGKIADIKSVRVSQVDRT
ncbi:FxLYD domain-containing protein [Streptomyces javensis]|uniref:FxLYD domain-containing protein n=1 Tax=Streptomyces javensis TaxID=114698 RepID=UPI0033F2A0B7